MILPSKECLLINSFQNKQFFMFDPKTTAVLHKYRDDTSLTSLAYYHHSQQILAQQSSKTFINVWSYDTQQAQLRISMSETMTSIVLTKDGHFIVGGGETGNLYFWEMPNGILIKKKNIHSSQIRHVIEYSNNHIITATKTEIKVWPLSSFFIEVDNTSAMKSYTSVLEIVAVAEERNILAVLTHKSITFLQLSLQTNSKQLQSIHKIDYQYASTMCLSKTCAFVGDSKGNIQVIQLFSSEQQRSDLAFRLKQGTKQLQIWKPKKKRVLTGATKHPVTTLTFVESLSYLISGHASGQVVIWNNYEVKKSLHLFKTPISLVITIPKPKDQKIYQPSKIQPLNKYQLGKDQQLLDIIPSQLSDKTVYDYETHLKMRENEEEQDSILKKMLETVHEPQKLMKEQLQSLKSQRKMLLSANLHYFNLLSE